MAGSLCPTQDCKYMVEILVTVPNAKYGLDVFLANFQVFQCCFNIRYNFKMLAVTLKEPSLRSNRICSRLGQRNRKRA